jgi:hypothetical protein
VSENAKLVITAHSIAARYGKGTFSFYDTLPLPDGVYGQAGHNKVEVDVEDEAIREAIQDIFEIGATYEITIKKVVE